MGETRRNGALSVLVPDALAVGGLRPGVNEAPAGGTIELSAQGRIGIPGTRMPGGAALPLKNGIVNAARLHGFSLQQALRMATPIAADSYGPTAWGSPAR